jgi:voltage-gated potassium channel
MNETGDKHSEHVGPFQVVVLILSVVVLGALGADTIFKFPQSVSNILQVLDTAVCVLLLVDFGFRFHKAPSKLAFMKWGWIDLLASIPYIPWLRAGRVLRILRVIRLLRAIRATQKISALFLHDKLQTGVASVGLTAFLLIIFCSIGVLICEQQSPHANILTAEDAIWWSVTTITTVGYGDKYPVTTEGRIVAMILMFSGIGLFGVLSGLAASYFLHTKHPEDEQEKSEIKNEILMRLQKIEEKIDKLSGRNDPPAT